MRELSGELSCVFCKCVDFSASCSSDIFGPLTSFSISPVLLIDTEALEDEDWEDEYWETAGDPTVFSFELSRDCSGEPLLTGY